MDYQRLIDRADHYIVERSRLVILAFLLVTLVFAVGLGAVSTDAGTSAFSQDIPAEKAFQQVNQKFSPSFSDDSGTTQLIQSGNNVLGKPALLRMLEVQERAAGHDSLRVTSTSSAATIVATTLDPSARSPGAQIRAVESATDGEIDAAVRTAAERNPQFSGLVSRDFNRECACASATIGVVTHEVPAGISGGSGQGGASPLTPIQQRMQLVVDSVQGAGDIRVFGSGIIAQEFSSVIVDSLIIVVPAAVVFILLFLVISYRDLADLLLGVLALAMTIVWTFGFMGLAGIPFNQILIAVPPLLLAVGIDFGIHTVNRYREERERGVDLAPAMRTTTDQLLVAFGIVTGTTVIGFGANLLSDLPPIQDFGIVAAVGITFTSLVFGVFLPAAKVELDRLRQEYPIPTFSTTPLGNEGSTLGRLLSGGVPLARRFAVPFLLLTLVASGGMAFYATGVDTSFSNDDFLPPEENPDYLTSLPEPFAPSEYSVTAVTNFLEEEFESGQSDSVTVYVEGPLSRDPALESIYRAGDDPPSSFVTDGGHAQSTSIVTVIRDYQRQDPEFRELVARNDIDDDGIPDDNLDTVYDYLLDSPARDRALNYMTADRRSAQVVYTVESSASQAEITADARTVADRYRFEATATGSVVVFESISDLILRSAIQSLVAALVGTALFLVAIYWVIEGEPTLGLANLFPIVVTVAFIAGSMRLFGISFNAFTATILAITIGLGIDYSVHITHRFVDEYHERPLYEALDRTVRGTGGALAGSMLTTVFGIGTLVLSVFPAIGQFGTLTGLSVVYSFIASLFVLPAALAVWARFTDGTGGTPSPDTDSAAESPAAERSPSD
ncbi:efflux RND transporter permease subunit [Halorarius halobius]|uniref:efflux RND transporter permease subunit n=1 Tax=Halorarius halobius TaxID=2962671 RepID=UPI0020CF09F7|nr:MMPL family transporter [Halorarius halobius]